MANSKDGTAFFTPDLAQIRRCIPLDNKLGLPPAKESLGALRVLPTELLRMVLAEVDVPSLTAFRRVNRAARTAVDAVPEYAYLHGHQPDVLRAVVATHAHAFTCGELHAELRREDPTCRSCGTAPATHLYLITGRAVCRPCFVGDIICAAPTPYLDAIAHRYRKTYPHPPLTPVTRYRCMRPFSDWHPLKERHVLEHCEGLTKKDLDQVPHILSLPTRYRQYGKAGTAERGVKLYDMKILLANYKLSDCNCLRSCSEVATRYQAVVALSPVDERESEGDRTFGWNTDPFEECFRAKYMN